MSHHFYISPLRQEQNERPLLFNFKFLCKMGQVKFPVTYHNLLRQIVPPANKLRYINLDHRLEGTVEVKITLEENVLIKCHNR